MKMMLKFLTLLCFMALCHAFPSADETIDVDKVLEEIFDANVEKNPPVIHALASDKKGKHDKNDFIKCSKSDSKTSVCVPYYMCDYQGLPEEKEETTHSFTDELPLNIRMPIDPGCSSYMEVCCEEKYVITGFQAAPAEVL